MSTPTEQKIRETIERAFEPGGVAQPAFDDAFTVLQLLLDDFFDLEDFRPSEEEAWNATTQAAVSPVCKRAKRDVQRALTEAALRFITEHPAAPLATEAVTA